ncbi:MAG: riboflavin synthase subunit beta [Flavobacteriales bacterium]|jgi:hypothetical protein|nr:riboflavin synthase subunit beta [Flavobacteriales bacterium]
MGFVKRKIKKFEYQPRYYKGEENPYQIKHKFDQFRDTVGAKKSIKKKVVDAINELKERDYSVDYNDEVFDADIKQDNSNRIIIFMIIIFLLIFLFVIDFDLSIFYQN